MESYYSWLPTLLPFQWTQYVFMQNALLAVLLVTPTLGILGTIVVNNKMAFFSDAIGHSALTGIAIGVILGFQDPLGAMIGFSILLALGISFIKESNAFSTDTVIGVFSATAVALGIVILSQGGGFAKYSRYLIGDLLSITPREIAFLAAIALLILFFWVFMFNGLLLASLNPSLARSRRLAVRALDTFFMILMAIIVTVSIQWVGLLIINSLLILPAASARILAKNMRQYHLFSLLIAITSGVGGLILSYYWSTATGATIVLCGSFFFLLSFVFRSRNT